MQSFINIFRGLTPQTKHGHASMPLQDMRTSDDTPLNARDLEDREDGEQDIDPLLPSAEGTLERVKAEIEHELAASGGDTVYDRTCT
jgi:hypothetical protein